MSYDVLGLFDKFVPPFVKQYAHLGEAILNAARSYAEEVREGVFPSPAPTESLSKSNVTAVRRTVEAVT